MILLTFIITHLLLHLYSTPCDGHLRAVNFARDVRPVRHCTDGVIHPLTCPTTVIPIPRLLDSPGQDWDRSGRHCQTHYQQHLRDPKTEVMSSEITEEDLASLVNGLTEKYSANFTASLQASLQAQGEECIAFQNQLMEKTSKAVESKLESVVTSI